MRQIIDVNGVEYFCDPETEMRYCTHCGKPIDCGMTTDDGDCYVHEDCFEEYMDKTYGKGNWKSTDGDKEDGAGGYYLVRDDENSEWYGSGIYYTEWYDDYDVSWSCDKDGWYKEYEVVRDENISGKIKEIKFDVRN